MWQQGYHIYQRCKENQSSFPKLPYFMRAIPDSKVHGAYMGSTWGRQVLGGPHVGPMILVIWDPILGLKCQIIDCPVVHICMLLHGNWVIDSSCCHITLKHNLHNGALEWLHGCQIMRTKQASTDWNQEKNRTTKMPGIPAFWEYHPPPPPLKVRNLKKLSKCKFENIACTLSDVA